MLQLAVLMRSCAYVAHILLFTFNSVNFSENFHLMQPCTIFSHIYSSWEHQSLVCLQLQCASLEDHTHLQCVCSVVGSPIHKMSSGDCGCMCPVYNGKYNTHVPLRLNLTSCDALQMVHCKNFWVTLTIFRSPQLHSFCVCNM